MHPGAALAHAEALWQPELPALPYAVREVRVRSALTRCTYPGLPWSLNPYQGCAHACAFCYVPSLLRVDREAWGRFVLVKRNAPSVLARELRSRPRGLVAVSTATDPYQALEARCLVTRRCLEVLARARWPVSVLSRSPLLLRDLDLLRRFDEVQVGMSVPTLDDAARLALEPCAPTVGARLRCLKAIAAAGLRTFASVAPLYPFTGGTSAASLADALADAGVQEAYVGPYRPYGDSRAHVLPRALASGIAGLERIVDAEHMGSLARELERELRARGIAAGGGRRAS